MKNKPALSFLFAFVLGYFLFGLGLVVSSNLLAHSSLLQPTFMAHRLPHPLMDFLSSFIIVSGAASLSLVLRGSFWIRWTLLSLLMYVLAYVLSTWEAAYFTKFGGTAFLFSLWVLPSLFCCAAFAWLVKGRDSRESITESTRHYFQSRPLREWLLRLSLAWVAFPAVYFLFGSCVAPIVVPFYKTLDFLVLPPFGFLIKLQLARSLCILAVLLLFFIVSKASRLSLGLALGWAFYAWTGLSGMVGGDFFPTPVRWAHGVELLMDSIVYVTAATLLLARPKTD
jgi:hypothetical protein